MRETKVTNHRSLWNNLIAFFLLSCAASTVLGQGCSITGETGQIIDIYGVSLSTETEVVKTYEVQNTIEVDNAFNDGMSETYITAMVVDDLLIIHKTDKFGEYATNEAETVINLKVQFLCRSGSTTGLSTYYTFGIYLLATNDNAPVFSEANYQLQLPLPLPANFEVTLFGEILARDIDLGHQEVKFEGGNEYFEVDTIGRSETSKKDYFMSLKTLKQILTLPVDFRTFSIKATDAGGLSGEATVTILVDPENTYTRDPSPTFQNSIYNFRIDENGNQFMDFMYLTEESFAEGEITYSVEGRDTQYLGISEFDGTQVLVLFMGTYDEEEFEDRTYLTVQLVATREGYDKGRATILVDLPKVCAAETTTPAPCEITTCPDADGPVFSQKLYTFRVTSSVTGNFGSVAATIEDPNLSDSLRYRLNFHGEEWLESLLSIDEVTGSLSISAGEFAKTTFDIEVIAIVESEETTLVGVSRIFVTIEENEKCVESSLEKTLTFITVLEEQRNEDIFPMILGDCEYELLAIHPSRGEGVELDFVFVDENRKLCTSEIDRESEIFGGMTVPQIQVKLKLVCNKDEEEVEGLKRKKRDTEFVDNVFTDEISFQSDITQLNIFIEDINDNAPVIEFPSGEGVAHVGYPTGELAQLLLPQYLIKIEASDADQGTNAELEFTISSNDFFGIDSKTGIVFPLTSETEEKLFIEIQVSDGVHLVGKTLRVHKLTLEHLVVVYVENFGYHEIEEVSKQLNQQLGQSLEILKYGNVPVNYQKKSLSSRATNRANLKLITYAYGGDGELVTADELLKKMQQIDELVSFSLYPVTLEEEIVSDPIVVVEDDSDNQTFVAIIITLGVLVVILLIGGFVGWWFLIRPTEWKHIEETSSVENVQVVDNVPTTEEMTEKERPSLNLNGHTWTESSDSSPQIMKNITNIEDGDQPTTKVDSEQPSSGTLTTRERKKSITFNESVERIEIETEVPVNVTSYHL